MPWKDRAHDVKPVSCQKPQAITATVNPSNSNSVDTSGYESVVFLANIGTWTDGSFTPALYESDDNSTFTAVAAGDQVGSFTAITDNTQVSTVQWVGYKGFKRYVACKLTVSGATTGMLISVSALLGDAHSAPTF